MNNAETEDGTYSSVSQNIDLEYQNACHETKFKDRP